MVAELNDENYTLLTDGNNAHLFLDFFSYRCSATRIRAHFLQELAREYEETICFFQICVEDSPELIKRFRIITIPDSILIYQGRIIGRLTGFFSKGLLKERINNYLGFL